MHLPAVGITAGDPERGASADEIVAAVRAGYRLLDSAGDPAAEIAVASAVARLLADGVVRRRELALTAQLPAGATDYDAARAAIDDSLERLDTGQIELYLLPCAGVSGSEPLGSWRALIEARSEGIIDSIGLADAAPELVNTLIDAFGVVPTVNRLAVSPEHPRTAERAGYEALEIVVEARDALGGPRGLGELATRIFDGIAAAHAVTREQAVVAWHLQEGLLPLVALHGGQVPDALPGSRHPVIGAEELAAVREVADRGAAG